MAHNLWRGKKHYHEVIDNVSKHFAWYTSSYHIRNLVAQTPPMALLYGLSGLAPEQAGCVLDEQLRMFSKKNNKEIQLT